ncbi:MAG: hypothetical protein ACOVP4_03885 [Bacteriovoracaceae bacterium]|jgi:hypothetical protein
MSDDPLKKALQKLEVDALKAAQDRKIQERQDKRISEQRQKEKDQKEKFKLYEDPETKRDRVKSRFFFMASGLIVSTIIFLNSMHKDKEFDKLIDYLFVVGAGSILYLTYLYTKENK